MKNVLEVPLFLTTSSRYLVISVKPYLYYLVAFNHGQKSPDTLKICISGAFSNSHRPNPSPHPTNNVGRVYPEFFPSFNFVQGWGGSTARKFQKDAQFYNGTQNDRSKNILHSKQTDCKLQQLVKIYLRVPTVHQQDA